MASPNKKNTPATAAQAVAAAAPVFAQTAAPMPAAPSFKFAIRSDVPLPVRKSPIGTRGESIYPFLHLEIGQSFVVAPTEKNAEPWKTLSSMASRIARANWPRQFVTAREMVDGVECAAVFRREDATEPLREPRRRKPAEAAQEAPAAASAPVPNFG